ncbi:MAG: hypothetical protein R2754_11940 [Microthrixaceae bacterium]
MGDPIERLRADSRAGRSSALDQLSVNERSQVLTRLLASHPELVDEAEAEARDLLSDESSGAVEEDLAFELGSLGIDDLAPRCGRIPGLGYVNEGEAAYELLRETTEPFLADMERRSKLGLAKEASAIATGIIAGLKRCEDPEMGTVLAYAGEDSLIDLADETISRAQRCGITVPEEDD